MNTDKIAIALSFIVPVYNIDKELLRRCLRSLKNQNNRCEFLIVDDGSTNDAPKICDEFAKDDERFRVLHCKNQGVSISRNHGIDCAKGDYLIFVDGDDFIPDDFSDTIIDFLALNKNKDIIFLKNYVFMKGNSIKQAINTKNDLPLPDAFTLAKGVAEMSEFQFGIEDVEYGTPWGKCFKKSFIKNNNILFPVGVKKTQDRIFIMECLSYNPELICIDYYGYYYVINNESICQRYNPNIENIYYETYNAFLEMYRRRYAEHYDEMVKSLNYLRFHFFVEILKIYYLNFQNKDSILEKYKAFLKLTKKERKYYMNCKTEKIQYKSRKVILILNKMRLYGLCFYVFLIKNSNFS